MALSIGRMLKNVRAGEAHLLCRQAEIVTVRPCVVLGSSAFVDGGSIPAEYAGHGVGTNESPPLHWSGVPDRTAELVLVVEDPDAPLPRPFVHLIATGIAPQIRSFARNALSADVAAARGIALGRNTFGRREYAGPRALPDHGPHRYVFTIFALARRLPASHPYNKRRLLTALEGSVIGWGRLDGFFERVSGTRR